MNLRETILEEHSKQQTMKIVRWIGSDKERFKELLKLFLKGEYLVAQRAAWPLSYCAMEHPGFAKPYLKKLLENLKRPNLHNSVKRNTIRLLQDFDIPEELHGLVAEICFGYISSVTEPVAVKCFSMSVLANICKKHSELSKEFKMIIEAQLPYSTAGFRSRAKRTFKELNLE